MPRCGARSDASVGRFGDVALSVRVSPGVRFFGPRGVPGRFGDVALNARQSDAWRYVPEASA